MTLNRRYRERPFSSRSTRQPRFLFNANGIEHQRALPAVLPVWRWGFTRDIIAASHARSYKISVKKTCKFEQLLRARVKFCLWRFVQTFVLHGWIGRCTRNAGWKNYFANAVMVWARRCNDLRQSDTITLWIISRGKCKTVKRDEPCRTMENESSRKNR